MKRYASLILIAVLVIVMGGCAGMAPVSVDALESQASGVVAALEALPAVPADAKTQAQVDGWKQWLVYLAKVGSTVAVAAVKAGM
ncbi:hypothetical protein [Desulfovibrio sp. TomC]|uniref:hypothetical protein n=1 Tax=Desulfovibrio sp. TomC TaxID=1562888 RepID=UPI0005757330|nr:hypothetical protein [Desulfovibrio sp. TomC]KHK04034.1 hypothetical protein NY78_0476 [Desulfovibrio sp. TomC]